MSELRRRWAALALLGILTGLAAGLTLAAVEGASRTQSAYQRMRSQLRAADAVFFPSQVGIWNADVTKLSELPEVAAWGGFATTASVLEELGNGASPIVPVGAAWFTDIERGKVLEGRLPDPARDDEAVINPEALHYGAHLGDVLTWRSLSPADFKALGGYPPADYDWTKATGPVTNLHIVGVVRLPMESVLSFASGPQLFPGPGWAAAHLADVATDFTNAVVRLRHGAADVASFQAGVARIYGRDDIPVKDLSDDIKRVQSSLDVERTALLLFAAAVALAAAVLVGQAFARSIRAGAAPVPALRAMGLGRGGLVAGLVAPHLLTVAVAVATTAVTAVVLSSRFPIGLARTLDPAVGTHLDWGLLAAGLTVALAVTVLACWLIAAMTVRRSTSRGRPARTQLVGTATRAGVPVPAAVGVSLALEAPASRVGATARPALFAAIVGVFGVVGAVTLVGGIDDALHRPERVGEVWELEAHPGESNMDDATAYGVLAANPDVQVFAMADRFPTVVDGKDTPLYALQSVQGSMRFVMLRGRAPEADDELALGPRTASLVHAGVGATVAVGPSARPMKVVGISLLVQTPHSSFDEGAWLQPDALTTVEDPTAGSDDTTYAVLVQLRPGAAATQVQGALGAQGLYTEVPTVPPDVANLGNVRSLPLYLAAFLVLLAIGAVAHALMTGARSRSHDLAVLRALGLTPRQAAACVTWQATVIGFVALAIGIPLGMIVGRQVWRALADSLSFVYVGPLSGLVLLVLVPAALFLLVALALWPARAAARLHTAEILRSE